MHDHVYFDRRILSAGQAQCSAISTAALYGKGIFTTVAIYGGEPFLWEKHWLRLMDNAATLSIDLAGSPEESTKEALYDLIKNNCVWKGRARITFFDESASPIWDYKSERSTSLLITTADLRPVPDNFKVEISLRRISSLSKLAVIKSCNYLDNILAYEETKARGFGEAIRLNERDAVTCGCMANVFWLTDGKLFTPSLKTGCLPGTTREFILENLECEEVEENAKAIQEADSIFFTSAGLGVIQATELEGKQLSARDHSILHLVPQK